MRADLLGLVPYVRQFALRQGGSSLSSDGSHFLVFSFVAVFVGFHHPPDACRDPTFQTATRFFRILTLSDLPLVIRMAFGTDHPDLGYGGGMERRVQLPVAGA